MFWLSFESRDFILSCAKHRKKWTKLPFLGVSRGFFSRGVPLHKQDFIRPSLTDLGAAKIDGQEQSELGLFGIFLGHFGTLLYPTRNLATPLDYLRVLHDNLGIHLQNLSQIGKKMFFCHFNPSLLIKCTFYTPIFALNEEKKLTCLTIFSQILHVDPYWYPNYYYLRTK